MESAEVFWERDNKEPKVTEKLMSELRQEH